MRIAAIYSFNSGHEVMRSKFAAELTEIEQAVNAVGNTGRKPKRGKVKSGSGRSRYLPTVLAQDLRRELEAQDWRTREILCEFTSEHYVHDYRPSTSLMNGVRSLDFVKNQVGVESQFGKPTCDVCNACARMTIFHNLNVIDVGVEIVPLKDFANDMSTGVSYFEQFVWDLEQRSVSDIDIPVLILGVIV